MEFKLAQLITDSIVDGPGLRLAVFAQGCPHGCPGCHNPQTHDPAGGIVYTTEQVVAAMDANPLLGGVTLTGGEPFLQAEAMAEVAVAAHKRGLSVITYTGFTLDEILDGAAAHPHWGRLASESDWLVEGRFDLAQRTLSLPWRGSRNQRILRGKNSMEARKAIEAENPKDV